jgi:glycosyltransferase involved in cell wall biosynthesis
MNKVFVLAPGESWIVDRFVSEWNADNADISVTHPKEADVVWLFADWCWEQLAGRGLLDGKKVITTIHHIVPEKFFDHNARNEFNIRDSYTTVYHVPNKHTEEIVRKLTNKPVHVIPYWANQNIWRPTSDKVTLRKKFGIPLDAYVIGSFQRDTEGSSADSSQPLPKLEKGPDLFCDFVIDDVASWIMNTHVLLSGWRRQYVIDRLKKADVKYTYVEFPKQDVVNELYQCLDLYAMTARFEGGPQSLIECGLLNVPVVATPCGMSELVLPDEAINVNVAAAKPRVPNVETLKLPGGYMPFRNLIKSL